MSEQIKVTINEKEIETDAGARLIDVCRENGFGIPSFCYYQDLEIQASCRMCLVRIDKMPKLQTSCTIKCTDGMVVTTQSEEVEKAQRAMGEFLLTNHPLDCPVCDRGGECELQEVIFDWGDVEERFIEDKNRAPEKYLSPMVANDACVSPPSSAATCGAPPLYGIWLMLMPDIEINRAICRWGALPLPEDE